MCPTLHEAILDELCISLQKIWPRKTRETVFEEQSYKAKLDLTRVGISEFYKDAFWNCGRSVEA